MLKDGMDHVLRWCGAKGGGAPCCVLWICPAVLQDCDDESVCVWEYTECMQQGRRCCSVDVLANVDGRRQGGMVVCRGAKMLGVGQDAREREWC